MAISSVPMRRAADDEQLRRLNQHADLAVLHQVAADDRSHDDNHSNDCEHVDLTMSLGNIVAPAGLPRLDEVLIGRAGQSFAAPAKGPGLIELSTSS